tara:strand:+ start:135 stop:326 length:192 start_codon:yes stop_codon:yes gene_type:complete
MKCELVCWEDIRKACKYPITDNNNGYIYGINIINDNEIIDVEWFKTDEERFKEIEKYKLKIVN